MSGDLSAVAMMREAFDRRATTMHELLNDIPGVTCIEPQGAFYCFPNLHRACSAATSAGRTCTSTLELADRRARPRPRWRSCPARRSARPGYARFSFAVGDDIAAEGIPRIAKFVAS